MMDQYGNLIGIVKKVVAQASISASGMIELEQALRHVIMQEEFSKSCQNIVERAKDIYCDPDDTIEVDRDAIVIDAYDGYWVSGWLWVGKEVDDK